MVLRRVGPCACCGGDVLAPDVCRVSTFCSGLETAVSYIIEMPYIYGDGTVSVYTPPDAINGIKSDYSGTQQNYAGELVFRYSNCRWEALRCQVISSDSSTPYDDAGTTGHHRLELYRDGDYWYVKLTVTYTTSGILFVPLTPSAELLFRCSTSDFNPLGASPFELVSTDGSRDYHYDYYPLAPNPATWPVFAPGDTINVYATCFGTCEYGSFNDTDPGYPKWACSPIEGGECVCTVESDDALIDGQAVLLKLSSMRGNPPSDVDPRVADSLALWVGCKILGDSFLTVNCPGAMGPCGGGFHCQLKAYMWTYQDVPLSSACKLYGRLLISGYQTPGTCSNSGFWRWPEPAASHELEILSCNPLLARTGWLNTAPANSFGHFSSGFAPPFQCTSSLDSATVRLTFSE